MKMRNGNGWSRDRIKYIAVLAMLLNHVAHVFLTPGTLLYEAFIDAGYFTAITMCYFLVEGYERTRSRKKYGQRLLVFALISELPFCLAFTENGILQFTGMNMIFTLLICFGIITVVHGAYGSGQKRLLILALTLASLICDWPVFAPAFTLLFLRDRGLQESLKKDYFCVAVVFGASVFLENTAHLSPAANLLSSLGAMAAILASGGCVLYLYNGKRTERGKSFSQWFFYWFYPVHLLILGAARVWLQR